MTKIKVADYITLSRVVFSAVMLFFTPKSCPFVILYICCGISDVADGMVARKTKTESEKGAKLDSIADLCFAVVYAVKILPLFKIPLWIWIWIAVIALIKITGAVVSFVRRKSFFDFHSPDNKITGIMIFLLPLATFFADVKYCCIFVCIIATCGAVYNMTKPSH